MTTLQRQRELNAERVRRHRAGLPAPKRVVVRIRNAEPTPSLGGAACAGEDPDLWFSENPEDQALAVAICRACPVRLACNVKAEANGEQFGIWAGENRAVRRTRRRAA